MANINQFQNTPSNTGTADTNNLGFSGVSKWGDSSIQNSQLPNQVPPNMLGQPASGIGGAQSGVGVPPPPSIGGTGYSIPGLIQTQLAGNTAARTQNQNNWDSAKANLMQYTTPFTPDVIANMKNSNAMLAQGGENNAFTQQAGILAASGQNDASSLAAAAATANRNALGAQVGNNTNIGIQAQLANNQAGQNVGNSILSHLPQVKPDDLSGIIGLTGQMQTNQALLANQQNQQQFQNSLLMNQFNKPISPGATNGRPIVGAGDPTQAARSGPSTNGILMGSY